MAVLAFLQWKIKRESWETLKHGVEISVCIYKAECFNVIMKAVVEGTPPSNETVGVPNFVLGTHF